MWIIQTKKHRKEGFQMKKKLRQAYYQGMKDLTMFLILVGIYDWIGLNIILEFLK